MLVNIANLSRPSYSIVYVSTTKICSNYDPGLTLTHFSPKSNLVTQAVTCAKEKLCICLENIAAIGLKVGWIIQLNEVK